MLKAILVFFIAVGILQVVSTNSASCQGEPPATANGNPVIDSRDHGTVVWYRCNDYFKKTKPERVICDNGTWKGETPVCSDTRCYTSQLNYSGFGKPEREFFRNGENFEIKCEEGYIMSDFKRRMTCLDGKWDIQKNPCNLEIYCPVPYDPANGRVVYSSLKYGSELRYECNMGFMLTTSETRFCGSDGTWSNNEPECKEVRCEMPNSPDHGSVEIFGDPIPGNLAFYFCDDDTTMVGLSILECVMPGNWTFDPPKCLHSCKIPDIANGEVGQYQTPTPYRYHPKEFIKFQVGNSVNHSETVIVRCKEGFTPASDSLDNKERSYETTCNDGEWSKLLKCQEGDCSVPRIYHGDITEERLGDYYWSWRKQRYDRKVNYIEISAGTVVPLGTTIILICHDGYSFQGTQIGRSHITCTVERWLPDPACLRDVTCGRFQSSPTLEVSYSNDDRVNSTASFSCSPPNNLIGNSFAICQPSGTWSHTLPSCEEPKCSIDTLMMSIPEGVIPDMSDELEEFHSRGSELRLQCEDDSILTGSSKAICGSFGEWKVGNVLCIPGCLLSKDVFPRLIIEPVKEYYRFGESILLSCPQGLKLNTEIERVMCLGKTWSDDIPNCTEGD